ncbi:hypothetical protein WYO_0333 [Methylobacterium sp. GXF4]|nr:hypothetical protein WYO_0333 [Methylobacterium sp. GXF4]
MPQRLFCVCTEDKRNRLRSKSIALTAMQPIVFWTTYLIWLMNGNESD